jgi:hypothetical protein
MPENWISQYFCSIFYFLFPHFSCTAFQPTLFAYFIIIPFPFTLKLFTHTHSSIPIESLYPVACTLFLCTSCHHSSPHSLVLAYQDFLEHLFITGCLNCVSVNTKENISYLGFFLTLSFCRWLQEICAVLEIYHFSHFHMIQNWF